MRTTTRYRATGRSRPTRTKAKQILADAATRATRSSSCSRPTPTPRWPARTRWSRGSRRPASRPRRSPTTIAEFVEDRDDSTATSTCGPTAGARTGRRARPGSRRSSSRRTSRGGLRHQRVGVQQAGDRRRRSTHVFDLPAEDQPAAWNDLEGDHDRATSRSSRGTTPAWCSPRLADRGHASTTRSACRRSAHLGPRRLTPVSTRAPSSNPRRGRAAGPPATGE